MPRRRETPIPMKEYLIDAIRHIEDVTGQVQQTIEGARKRKLDPREFDPRIFGRACDVAADLFPRPFGRGCAGGPELRVPRERRSARLKVRRRSRALKRVKR